VLASASNSDPSNPRIVLKASLTYSKFKPLDSLSTSSPIPNQESIGTSPHRSSWAATATNSNTQITTLLNITIKNNYKSTFTYMGRTNDAFFEADIVRRTDPLYVPSHIDLEVQLAIRMAQHQLIAYLP
jgi:hypothetical protein